MAIGDGIRRDVSTISQAERDRLRDAILHLKHDKFYGDGTSYWDKQEQIHKDAHAAGQNVHAGPAFLAWHRELINRFEDLLRIVDPDLSLHYWDWTTDPRIATATRAALFTPAFMGSPNGDAGAPLADFQSSEGAELGNGHDVVWRNLAVGAPAVPPDAAIISASDGQTETMQFVTMEAVLHNTHDYIHSQYIRGTISVSHYSFHDPFVFLLHSNVDRLWARWQRDPNNAWRLDPTRTYGIRGSASSINSALEPWAGGPGLRPWASPENEQLSKTPKDLSVVVPRAYDTDPLTFAIDLSRWEIVARILFGVIQDGPGVVIGPDGKPHPVGPWGPLLESIAKASQENTDILLGMAIGQIAPLARNEAVRKALGEAGQVLVREAAAHAVDRVSTKRAKGSKVKA